jgi:hypothetical protein
MISTLLIWLYIFILSTSFGHLLFRGCASFLKIEINQSPTLLELSIIGLTGLGTLLSFFSIFFKIGLLANCVFLFIVLTYFVLNPRDLILYYSSQVQKLRECSVLTRWLLVLYFVMILLAAQASPKVYDTGLYHAQFIQWISSFKTIPGLGNLHGRFAYNNQSFLLESFFSLEFLKLGYFHLLNSFLLFLFSGSLLISLQETMKSDWIKSFLYFGLLILIQIYYLVFGSSPTPDIYSTVGIWFVFITFFKRLKSGNDNKIYWIIIIFISFFLVTVKLSSIPIILISLIYLTGPVSGILKKAMTVTVIGLIVFAPFFIRNYLISGYLVYPFPGIDLFNPDWKMPLANVQEMKSVIASFAQSRDWVPRPISEWLPIWFSNLSVGFTFLSVLVLLSPIFLTLIFLMRKSLFRLFLSEIKILIICFLAVIFWFFSAPNLRFVYGFLFIYILVIGMIFLHWLVNENVNFRLFARLRNYFVKKFYKKAVYSIIVLFPLIFFITCDYNETISSLVFPVKYKEVAVDITDINGIKVNIPKDNAQCWNVGLPCSIRQGKIGITNIEQRGKDLEDGFRVRK